MVFHCELKCKLIILFWTGSRSALVNMEARPLNSEVLTRRCVLARLQDLTVDRFRELIAQGAGAVLILLPRNMSHVLQQSVEVSAKYNSLASDFQKEKILEEIHKNIPECTFSLKEEEGGRGLQKMYFVGWLHIAHHKTILDILSKYRACSY